MKRLALLALASCVLLAGCGSALPPGISAVEPLSFSGNAPPLLVDAAWASQQISSASNLVVLDASTLDEYRAGHLPGAVHVWWQDTLDPNGPTYGMVLKPDENAADPQLLRKHFIDDIGVSPDSTVLVYDREQSRFAARIAWTLRFLGFPNAAVLDGGLAAWIGSGGKVEKTSHDAPSISNPVINPLNGFYLLTDKVVAAMSDSSTLILDIRSDEQLKDDIDGTITPGSIPGSVRIPWTDFVSEDGRLKSSTALMTLLTQSGVSGNRTIILYGRFGSDVALPWLALKLLGFPVVLTYDNGWAGWSADPATPKA